jgi:hypothetical protein
MTDGKSGEKPSIVQLAWSDETCTGFEARIREMRRAVAIAERNLIQARADVVPLNQQLDRLEAVNQPFALLSLTNISDIYDVTYFTGGEDRRSSGNCSSWYSSSNNGT